MRHGEAANGCPLRGVAQFGIATKVSDENYFVDRGHDRQRSSRKGTPVQFGARIFYQPIGRQHIVTNLRSKTNFLFVCFQFLRFGATLFQLHFIKTRTQDLHGHRTVLMLRALVLTLHDYVGGEMRNAHGGIRRVDVLAARTGRAISVHPQIFVVDFDLDLFIDFGINKE